MDHYRGGGSIGSNSAEDGTKPGTAFGRAEVSEVDSFGEMSFRSMLGRNLAQTACICESSNAPKRSYTPLSLTPAQTVRYTWQTGLVKDGLWVPGEGDDQSLPGPDSGADALSG